MPKGIPDTRVLTDEEKYKAYDMALNGVSLSNIGQTLGFPNRMAFHSYRQRDLAFDRDLQSARVSSGPYREDDIFDIPNKFWDPAMARVALEAAKTGMAFLDPAKYSPRMDVNVTQTISLRSAIDAAEQRIIDVTPGLKLITSDIDDIL